MGFSTRTRRTSTTLVLALVLGLLGAAGTTVGSALVAPAAVAAGSGQVVGEVLVPGNVKLKVSWFDASWTFLGSRKVTGSIYSLNLPAGTYHLQFTDERPAYLVDKYAPTDLKVTVRAGTRTQENVRMQRGAAITGTVRAGGQALGGAQVVAASKDERSFRVKANRKGQYALGGLPEGSYSVFTYDRRGTWVDRSTFVKGLRSGAVRHVPITLRTKAGRLLVELRAGGARIHETVFVTAVSKASGQFWTVRATRGEASFKGLYPGGYTLVAPGVGRYLAREATVTGARVRSGRADLASSFSWTRMAAGVTGSVTDARYPVFLMKDVVVELYDARGARLTTTTTDERGRFSMHVGTPTLDEVTVRIRPGGFTVPYLQGRDAAGRVGPYCKFGATALGPLSVAAGDEIDLTGLALPHLPSNQQDSPEICG